MIRIQNALDVAINFNIIIKFIATSSAFFLFLFIRHEFYYFFVILSLIGLAGGLFKKDRLLITLSTILLLNAIGNTGYEIINIIFNLLSILNLSICYFNNKDIKFSILIINIIFLLFISVILYINYRYIISIILFSAECLIFMYLFIKYYHNKFGCRNPKNINYIGLGLIIFLLTIFWWTIQTSGLKEVKLSTPVSSSINGLELIANHPSGAYNWQVESILHGKSALLFKPSEELLALKNPYEPKGRPQNIPGDMSFYNGQYYSYFGITPLALIFLPVKIITGYYATERLAVFLISFLCLFFSYRVGILFSKLYLNSYPLIIQAIPLFIFCTNNIFGYIIRSQRQYEIAALSANLFTTGFIYYALKFISCSNTTQQRINNIRLAAVCAVLGFGSRPSTVIILILSIFLVIYFLFSEFKKSKERKINSKIFTFIFRIAWFPTLLLSLILYWNYLRFDNFLEFGFNYILTNINVLELKRDYKTFLGGVLNQLFCPWVISHEFPYVRVLGVLDITYDVYSNFQIYDVLGLIYYCPVILLIIFLAIISRSFDYIGCLLILSSILYAGFVCYLASGVTLRYMLEVLPFFLIASCYLLRPIIKISAGYKYINIILIWYGIIFGGVVSILLSFTGQGSYLLIYNKIFIDQFLDFIQ